MDNQLLSIGKVAKILGVSIKTLQRWDKSKQFLSVRIGKGNRYYRKTDIDLFLNDNVAMVKKWVLSDSSYEPPSEYFCKIRDIFQARLEHFQAELSKIIDPNKSSLISAIVGEIGNNSFDHNLGNWPDILGIYFAYSLSEKRIILADRGLGILFTLKKIKPNLVSHREALNIAFTETISGRAPENRGNGLKFVKNVVTQNPLKLYFQTGNAILNLGEDNQDVHVQEISESIRGCLAIVNY